RWKIPPEQRQRIQMVLLREGGMTQPAIAAAMGVSLSTVNRAHMAYDHGGIKTLKPQPRGGRKRENMTQAEEKMLLARFAKAAGAGEMLNIHDLKAAYEKAIGHQTSNSTIYNLLARHGWRKLMPRLFHHAAIRYGVLPSLPQCPGAKVCQAGYSLGSRWHPQPSLQRSRAPRKHLAALLAALLARI